MVTSIKPNDTIQIKGENTFFEIELGRGDRKYALFPRAQINPGNGWTAGLTGYLPDGRRRSLHTRFFGE